MLTITEGQMTLHADGVTAVGANRRPDSEPPDDGVEIVNDDGAARSGHDAEQPLEPTLRKVTKPG